MGRDNSTITLQHSTTASGIVGSASRTVEVPSRVGSVQLQREIGRGGMGVVWAGRDELLQRNVAVKFLLGAVSDVDDPAFKGFIEGSRAAAVVRRHHLNAVYHADLVGQTPYLVMEYIDGPTLANILRCKGPLDVATTLAVVSACAEAIAELHDHGIVHRDIKPSNIMVDASGRMLVTDFGIACGRVPMAASLNVDVVAGTPEYMAPEMFSGVVSTRSDVYALGATLFECLVGSPPYRPSTVGELGQMHSQGVLPVERLRQVSVPEPVIELVERSMNKNPRFRIKTARQFLTALKGTDRDNLTSPRDALIASMLTAIYGANDKSQLPHDTCTTPYFSKLSVMAERRTASKAQDMPSLRASPESSIRAGTLQAEVPCISCGYNLRGSTQDRCVECGTPICDSIAAERHYFGNRQRVRAISRGLGFLQLAGLGFILAFIAYPFTFLVLERGFDALNDAVSSALEWVVLCAVTAGAMLLMTGSLLILKDQPSRIFDHARIDASLRIMALIALLGGLVSFEFVILGTVFDSYPPDFVEATSAILVPLGLAGVTWHISLITRRAPNYSFAKRERAVACALMLLSLLYGCILAGAQVTDQFDFLSNGWGMAMLEIYLLAFISAWHLFAVRRIFRKAALRVDQLSVEPRTQ